MKANFNGFDLGRGGGNRFIFDFANGLVDQGHKVTITHLKSSVNYLWFGEVKAEVINLNFPSRAHPNLSNRSIANKKSRNASAN